MESDTHLSNTRLDSLPLHPLLKERLAAIGFEKCTPIQAQTLPLALNGEDIAGQAQTGTGKTAAFLLATMHHLLTQPVALEGRVDTQPRAFMLAPTRELAIQIYNDAMQLQPTTGLRISCVYGGTGYDAQRSELEAGVDILIGTPGRLIDYFKQRVYDLKAVEICVLDEADRMFDLGFIKDIRYLLRSMPEPSMRMNLLFSATLSHRVLELAYEHMNEPTLIRIESDTVTAENIRETLYHVPVEDKIPLLLGILKQQNPHRTMLFVNTRHEAHKVVDYLNANGFKAAALSGDVKQNQRERLLGEFKDGSLPILVATDVAARGLHIPEVSHVINYDMPQDREDYVHRIGRTARAGAEGDAITLCCDRYVYSLPEIEDYIGHKIPVEHETTPLMFPDVKKPTRSSRPPSSRDGKGGNRGGGRGRSGGRSGGGGRPPRRR